MDTLENAIKDVIGWYGSGGGLQNEAFTFFDDTQKAYSVNIHQYIASNSYTCFYRRHGAHRGRIRRDRRRQHRSSASR